MNHKAIPSPPSKQKQSKNYDSVKKNAQKQDNKKKYTKMKINFD